MPIKGFQGQPVNGSLDIIAQATPENNIRMITIQRNSSCIPLQDCDARWEESTPQSVANVSATAYFFACYLQNILNVPVGIEEQFPEVLLEVLNKDLKDISKPHVEPTLLYNAMINPIQSYTIKGAIWYQGEANRDKPELYKRLFPAMVQLWRNVWKQGDFPFYYVQIAPYDYGRENADKKEAIQIAINAGIDMAMEPYDLSFCTLLKELVQEDKVQMSRIDDAVRRILRLKFRLNLFECPNTLSEDYPLFGSSEHAELALRSAEESQILLKNKDNILPLVKGKKFLVTGPNANSMRCLNGGWSYSWQGHLADRFAGKYNTIYEALSNKFGVDNVRLEQGVTYKPEGGYTEENEPEIEKAVAAARNVDIIIACIGENSYCETPGNLSDLVISANQSNLVKALATTRKPIILILNEGRPRIINDLEPLASGIINILLPGNYGGDALANILAGDVNPSAKMPYTYPRNQAELTTYDYRVSEEMDKMEGAYDYDAVISVQWPFGYGLSYTTFEYSNFQTNVTSFTAENELHFSIDVTNSGARAGKEVVTLFSRDLVASLTLESRRLQAFKKVELQPGETKTVTMLIKGSDLAFVGADGKWILEQGDFRMQIGNQTVNITCNKTYKWNTPNK